MALIKIAVALLSKSILFAISSLYNLTIGCAKNQILKKKDKNEYIYVGVMIILSSIVYIFYSIFCLINYTEHYYTIYESLLITLISFIDLIFAISGIRKSKKLKDFKNEVIKLTNLATTMISISLAQTSILSFKGLEADGLNSALGGVFFGILALCVGIYTVFRTTNYYLSYSHKL